MISSTIIQEYTRLRWYEQKGRLKDRFSALTDEDLQFNEGKREEMLNKVQAKLGLTKLLQHFEIVL